jgi:hypothetical protein
MGFSNTHNKHLAAVLQVWSGRVVMALTNILETSTDENHTLTVFHLALK